MEQASLEGRASCKNGGDAMTIPFEERIVPCPPGLDADCTNEELFEWVRTHYFSAQELAEARRLEMESGYEPALDYLVKRGKETLRDSGEEKPPRRFITIPGPEGKILVHQPGTPAGSFLRAFSTTAALIARAALPQISHVSPTPAPFVKKGMASLWEEIDLEDAPPPGGALPIQAPESSRVKRARSRPKKVRYDEQPIQVGLPGSGRYCHTVNGWIARDRGLGYVVEEVQKRQMYAVSIVHLGSHWVLASFFIDRLDDLTHIRLRQFIEEVADLTDWTLGIQHVLKVKQGKDKRYQWATHLLEVWRKLEQAAIFPLREEHFQPAEGMET
jgi:hypothetical protein